MDARHGLHIADVKALGHEDILAFSVEGVFDLEELGPPFGLVILVADFGYILGHRPPILKEIELPVVQIVDVDVQERNDDMQLRVVDQVLRVGIDDPSVNLVCKLVLSRFSSTLIGLTLIFTCH